MLSLTEIQVKLSDRNKAEVARRLGVTRAYIAAIANGTAKPSQHFRELLSNYLQGQ